MLLITETFSTIALGTPSALRSKSPGSGIDATLIYFLEAHDMYLMLLA